MPRVDDMEIEKNSPLKDLSRMKLIWAAVLMVLGLGLIGYQVVVNQRLADEPSEIEAEIDKIADSSSEPHEKEVQLGKKAAEVLIEDNDEDAAYEYFKAADEVNEGVENIELLLSLAIIAEQQGDYEDAISYYEQAIEIAPSEDTEAVENYEHQIRSIELIIYNEKQGGQNESGDQ